MHMKQRLIPFLEHFDIAASGRGLNRTGICRRCILRPLPYRQCHDFHVALKVGHCSLEIPIAVSSNRKLISFLFVYFCFPFCSILCSLQANDKLDFRLGNVTTGSFSVPELLAKRTFTWHFQPPVDHLKWPQALQFSSVLLKSLARHRIM